jgi:diguanylate cyclase (GGDEF)-like protein
MPIHDLKILIADDDEDDFILIREFINDGFPTTNPHIDWARSGQETLSFLDTNAYNLCLLDIRLGEFNGLELLREVRKKGLTLPIIFLTGQGDEETAVEAMKLGASDYFGKSSLSGKILSHAITQSLELHNEKDQRHIAESALDAQGKLLQAVSEASTVLLTGKNHQDSIFKAMRILGETLKVNSAEIYQNLDSANGKRKFIKCFTWKKENFHTVNNEDIFANPNCGNPELERKFTSLNKNKFMQIALKELPLPAKELFSNQGIHSFILVPIIIEDVFWGFIAFGNSQPERQWSKNEESLLKTVAASIGSKIRRHDDEVAFHSIVEGTSSQLGDDFFRSLVSNLASALPVGKAYVSEMIGVNSSECSILAGWDNGDFVSNKNFNIKNTPFEEVIAGMVSFNSDSGDDIFNGNSFLGAQNVKSYAAVPCFDSHLRINGHLSVMDDKPMLDKHRTLSVLKIFAARAGAELERKRNENLIRNMAYHDALTGLPNRILLNDRLQMALAHAQRSQSLLAVLFMDFDHFKSINDNLGHDIGDQVLKGVAARLKKCLRSQDTVARLGGDEFILLLSEFNSPVDAENLATKILQEIRKPLQIQGHELNISLSIGVALFPRDGETSTVLLKHADEALYFAKKKGKNCFQFYNSREIGMQEHK